MINRQIQELEGKKERDMDLRELLLLRDWYFHRRDQVMYQSLAYERLTTQISRLQVEIDAKTNRHREDGNTSEGSFTIR